MAIGHQYWCYLLLLTCFLFSLSSNANNNNDSAIMLKLSASIAPTPPSWKTNNNYCNWEGISCDNFNRVTNISLSNKSLQGTLPSDLNSLSQLKFLDLSQNSLSGPLPTLANLSLLEQVTLDVNNFTSIPSDFFLGLTNLRAFKISVNSDLDQWILPSDHLKKCTKLQSFEAVKANLIGSIPDIFNISSSFWNLRLAFNNLTGKLPASIATSKITHLFLDNQLQGLSGNLHVISEMTQLNYLWLKANAFTGVIPDLSKFANLIDLQLGDNQLTGLVEPESWISLSSLSKITLRNNRLQGPLPVFARDVEYSLDNNSFCLPTPGKCDPQVTALLEVAASLGYPMSLANSWQGNDACGGGWSFVTCDSSGKNVTSVNFGKQNFSGTISPSFANLTSLRNLSLNENNLTGSIPEVLKSLPHLQFLDVSNNNLSGLIPQK